MSSCPLPSIVVRSSSFFTQHFITISPLVPPLFVDCWFKRRTKPLLLTMVSLLSSRPSALVGCFCCPPPPTLAASHGSRHQQSVALTASASTLPSPCSPLVVATPPAVPNSAVGAALENFPPRKAKKKFWFHVHIKKLKKIEAKKTSPRTIRPPQKSAISTFDDGGQYPPKVIGVEGI